MSFVDGAGGRAIDEELNAQRHHFRTYFHFLYYRQCSEEAKRSTGLHARLGD